VIARNSSFAYKGTSPDVRRVGEELGVRYVLEGSVRKGGKRVRVSAQLIDATNGSHVWAERYDRELEDTFALQDDLTLAIAGAIEPEIGMAERERAMRKPPENLNAWECYQRGLWHFNHFTGDQNREAQTMLRRAIDFDDTFAPAHAALSYTYLFEASLGFGDNFCRSVGRALDSAQRAVETDDKDYFAHTMLGRVYVYSGQEEAAIEELNMAVRLNPSFALAHYGLGQANIAINRPADGIRELNTAERLSPHDPFIWLFDVNRSFACILSANYQESLKFADRACRRQGKDAFWPHAMMAATQAHLERFDEAKSAIDAALMREPRLTISFVKDAMPYRYQDHFEMFVDGLRKAGLPEGQQ
jgi:tetratricopeptide (TPR) repeat protein